MNTGDGTGTSYFEAMCYSSVSKRPVFYDWYDSFSSFRMSLECLDLDQIKFKFPILYEFKKTPPYYKYSAANLIFSLIGQKKVTQKIFSHYFDQF